MAEENKEKEIKEADKGKDVPSTGSSAGSKSPRQGGGDRKQFTKNPRKPSRRDARVKPEFDQKIINIRRVTRVVTGGRRFSFSVALVAGNKKGDVGVGVGKGGDTALAIEKAFRDAKKNMINVNLTKEMRIPHEVSAKFCGSHIQIIPSTGSGVVAGSSVRTVIELAGIKGVSSKVLSRSKNKLNIAKATIEALKSLKGVEVKEKKVAPNQDSSVKTESKENKVASKV